MNEWPVMCCIADHAFADPDFDFLQLSGINRHWNKAVNLFIKRRAREMATEHIPLKVVEYVIRLSLIIVDVTPPPEFIDKIAEVAPEAAARLMNRFYSSSVNSADASSSSSTSSSTA